MLQLTGVILHGVGPYYTKNRLPISNLTLISGVNGSGKSSWFKVIDALRDSWKHKPAIADISEQVANAKEFRNEDFIHIGSLHFPWYLGLDASGVTRPATEANGILYDPSVVPRLINEHVVAENDGRSLEQINLSPNNRRPVFELEFCATEATVHLDAAQVDDTNLSDLEALLVLGVCRRGRRITVSLQHCAYGETNLYRRLALSVNSEQIAWESTAPAHQVRFDRSDLLTRHFHLVQRLCMSSRQ